MQPLDALVRQAASLAAGAGAHPVGAVDEAARVLQICNACRYCEGYCAVFPAMTRRLEFSRGDVHYLANLCHGCGACLHACQYAPPHEFGVNVPRALARVRPLTWTDHAWPRPLGVLYRRNGLVVSLALVAALALFLVLATPSPGSGPRVGASGDFYRVLPHGLLVALFGPLFVFVVAALAIGARRFFKGLHGDAIDAAPAREAARNALTLKYLDGGHGDGCNERDDAFTLARRRAHHLVFYGFMLCFAATCVATLYHYALGRIAPYDWTTLPKLLGTGGGLSLAAGSAWLLALYQRRHPLHREPTLAGMDRGFIALLFLGATSGLALAVARTTTAMPLLLAVHLASVMALFATLPYGKFAHGVYRAVALLKWAIEKRQPARLDVGEG